MSNDTHCKSTFINDTIDATLPVRIVAAFSMFLCSWALFNMRRCGKGMRLVVLVAINHTLFLHVCVALLTIVGISEALSTPQEDDTLHETVDTLYIWLALCCWQEHMLHLLLALVNFCQKINYDHAVLYSLATWTAAASPVLGYTKNYFSSEHGQPCSNLWRVRGSDVSRLSFIVPVGCSLVLMSSFVMAEMFNNNRKVRPTSRVCAKCYECAKDQVKIRSAQLLRLLVVQFVVTCLPQLVFWCYEYSSPSLEFSEYEWLATSSPGMSATLSGLITLYVQWQLVGCGVFPCSDEHGAWAEPGHTDDESSQRYQHSTSSRVALLRERRWLCHCDHCNEHRRMSEKAAADLVAAQAAAAFQAATSCTSIPRRDGSHRSTARGSSFKGLQQPLRNQNRTRRMSS